MGRKYIVQQQDINFVYPNNVLNQFDVEIVHDINDNCVTGTVTNFSAVTFTTTGMTLSFTYNWNLNGAERMLNASNTQTQILSLHGMRTPAGAVSEVDGYYNPWRMLTNITGTTTVTGQTATVTTGVLTPAMFGISSFTTDNYVFEFRMIGADCVLPICQQFYLQFPTATPTPTPTALPPTFTPTPTPTRTATPTPSPTPSGPTGTPTTTPTITPTPVCTCYYHNAIIGQADLNAATGNTLNPFRNNKVYTGYFDCNGNEAFKVYDTAGTYTNDLCPNGITVNVYYFVNNNATLASASSVVNTGVCCTVPTPTPTPTYTPTPTATNTPTPSPTPAPVGQCYCYPIVVTGTTVGGEEPTVIATLTYNDCFNTRFVRAFTVGPGTYYQCIQTVGGVPQYDPVLTEGINQSFINLTYQTGNCNTGYVCTGYVPATATPTPSPTPTPTGLPPTFTPTPTPTATVTPTPTPIYQGIGIYTGATFGTSTSACNTSTSPSGTVYASVAELPISDGDRLYTTVTLTFNFSGNGNYYRLFFNSQWYAAIISSTGYISDLTACSTIPTPTPTPTPSPTPTTAPSIYNYYDITRFTCPSCTSPVSLIGRNSTSGGTLITGNYYNPSGDGYVYRIDGYNAGPTFDIDLDGSASAGTNCSGTCAI
jgi:hypothetical protein